MTMQGDKHLPVCRPPSPSIAIKPLTEIFDETILFYVFN